VQLSRAISICERIGNTGRKKFLITNFPLFLFSYQMDGDYVKERVTKRDGKEAKALKKVEIKKLQSCLKGWSVQLKSMPNAKWQKIWGPHVAQMEWNCAMETHVWRRREHKLRQYGHVTFLFRGYCCFNCGFSQYLKKQSSRKFPHDRSKLWNCMTSSVIKIFSHGILTNSQFLVQKLKNHYQSVCIIDGLRAVF